MSGPIDLLTSGEIVFVPAKEQRGAGGISGGGHGAQLSTLAAWELADHRQALRSNLAGLNAGMLCAEIATHLLQPLDPHEDLFDQLAAVLTLLGDGNQRPRALLAYMKAALLSAGYWPQFGACLRCGKPIGDAPMRFSSRAGGVVCGTAGTCHVENEGMTIMVPGRIVVALDRLDLPATLQSKPPERAGDTTALLLAAQVLLTHIETITDKPLRTGGLLKGIFGVAQAK